MTKVVFMDAQTAQQLTQHVCVVVGIRCKAPAEGVTPDSSTRIEGSASDSAGPCRGRRCCARRAVYIATTGAEGTLIPIHSNMRLAVGQLPPPASAAAFAPPPALLRRRFPSPSASASSSYPNHDTESPAGPALVSTAPFPTNQCTCCSCWVSQTVLLASEGAEDTLAGPTAGAVVLCSPPRTRPSIAAA